MKNVVFQKIIFILSDENVTKKLLSNCTCNCGQVFTWSHYDLVSDGGHQEVDIGNLELYIRRCAEFYLQSGIRPQMDAFKRAFCRTFDINKLKSFQPDELLVGFFP